MDSCIEKGILKDVLIRQKTEVMHMLLTEFDEKKYKRSVYQDGYEDGVREARFPVLPRAKNTRCANLSAQKLPKEKPFPPSPPNWKRMWRQ